MILTQEVKVRYNGQVKEYYEAKAERSAERAENAARSGEVKRREYERIKEKMNQDKSQLSLRSSIMASINSIKRDPITVYQCTYCGTTQSRTKFQGRPMPGYCPRRGNMKDGKPLPHRWVISRKI